MRKYKIVVGLFLPTLVLAFLLGSCKDKKEENKEIVIEELVESPVQGHATMLVEESIFPIVEDVNILFEHEYSRVKLDMIIKNEVQIIDLLLRDSLRLAVLPRKLTDNEKEHFIGRVTPKQTHFASDAIVFIAGANYRDSVIDYQRILQNLKPIQKSSDEQLISQKAIGEPILVFDHYYSSVSSSFRELTNQKDFPKDYAYFLNNTTEVIEYVSRTHNAIGVIGLNWLTQPDSITQQKLKDLKILAVRNPEDGQYYKPNQNNIAEGTYPLSRELYVIDLQGKSGLGVGFASYIAGPKGQRIILKSGLFPFKTPPREVIISNSMP